ncbi:hypothetical protein GQX74_002151 [Glossina fuscipes]|nr:hypothetical protein GQX74_002151 [Glossina fuscipes]
MCELKDQCIRKDETALLSRSSFATRKLTIDPVVQNYIGQLRLDQSTFGTSSLRWFVAHAITTIMLYWPDARKLILTMNRCQVKCLWFDVIAFVAIVCCLTCSDMTIYAKVQKQQQQQQQQQQRE